MFGGAVSDSLGGRLQAVHDQVMDEPLPEGLERASCGPIAKHLAHLALHAARTDHSPDQWRTWVCEHVEGVTPTVMGDAEACMHSAGLWPWPD